MYKENTYAYSMHVCMHGFFQATFTLELFGAELLKTIVIQNAW